MTDSVANAAESAKDEVAGLRRDAEKLGNAVASGVSSGSNSARATVSQAASKVRDQGEGAYREAESMARQKAQDLENIIVSNPFATVAVALGIGLLIGTMSRRR